MQKYWSRLWGCAGWHSGILLAKTQICLRYFDIQFFGLLSSLITLR